MLGFQQAGDKKKVAVSALMCAVWWKYGLATEEKIVRPRAAGLGGKEFVIVIFWVLA